MVRFTLFAIVSAVSGPLPGHASRSAAPPTDDAATIAAYRSLKDIDLRVERVVFRLTVANAPLCRDVVRRIGVVLIDTRQFAPALRSMVATTFALNGELGFEAVDPAGPGWQAGLRDGDELVAINGVALEDLLAGKSYPALTADRLKDVEARIDRAPDDAIDMTYVRNGVRHAAHIYSRQGCASTILVSPTPGKNASADGDSILITTGLARLAMDDTDLAIVLAHELAHNILRHRERLDQAGIDRGFGRMFGKNRRMIRQTEEEADRVSLYLLANAGYDFRRAPAFWLGPARHLDGGLFSDGTHPCPACRAKLLASEIERIERLPKGVLLRPPEIPVSQP